LIDCLPAGLRYKAEDPTELSLSKWQVVNVVDHDQFGWFRGSVMLSSEDEEAGGGGGGAGGGAGAALQQEGWFPASFVEPYTAVIGAGAGAGGRAPSAAAAPAAMPTNVGSGGAARATNGSGGAGGGTAAAPGAISLDAALADADAAGSPKLWSSHTMDAIRAASMSRNVAAVRAAAAASDTQYAPSDFGQGRRGVTMPVPRARLERQSKSARDLRAEVLKRQAAVAVQMHASGGRVSMSPAGTPRGSPVPTGSPRRTRHLPHTAGSGASGSVMHGTVGSDSGGSTVGSGPACPAPTTAASRRVRRGRRCP